MIQGSYVIKAIGYHPLELESKNLIGPSKSPPKSSSILMYPHKEILDYQE